MKSLLSSEPSETIRQSKQRKNTEDLNLQQRRSENLKFRFVPQGFHMLYCGWNSTTQRSIPPRKTFLSGKQSFHGLRK